MCLDPCSAFTASAANSYVVYEIGFHLGRSYL
jgi:hypothetical protein